MMHLYHTLSMLWLDIFKLALDVMSSHIFVNSELSRCQIISRLTEIATCNYEWLGGGFAITFDNVCPWSSFIDSKGEQGPQFRKCFGLVKFHFETVHRSFSLNHLVLNMKEWRIFSSMASFRYCLLSIEASSSRVVREMLVSISWWAGRGQCGRSTRGSRRESKWHSGRRTTPLSEKSTTPGE